MHWCLVVWIIFCMQRTTACTGSVCSLSVCVCKCWLCEAVLQIKPWLWFYRALMWMSCRLAFILPEGGMNLLTQRRMIDNACAYFFIFCLNIHFTDNFRESKYVSLKAVWILPNNIPAPCSRELVSCLLWLISYVNKCTLVLRIR